MAAEKNTELRFALGTTILQRLCKETKENFVFSPLSLGTALTMLCAGLKDDTKKEVLSLLGTSDEAALHSMYTELIAKKDLPLKIANKYLVDHRVEVHQNFEQLLKSKYESEIQCVDFVKESSKAEKDVNDWVASKTNQMIKQLLSPGTLTPDTVLVLLNAVYFKGTWCHEFTTLPNKMDFLLRNGTKVQTDFMSKSSNDFKYNETAKLKMVAIPYNEAGCYMVVAIPKDENKHIDEVLSTMSASEMSSSVLELNEKSGVKVHLRMPKFKIDYKFGTLVDTMKALGVQKIFKAGEGDFGDLFAKVSNPPFVSDVIHQSVVAVDEIGTEAAAATAVVMMVGCCAPGFRDPEVYITVDRSFYFAIHADERTSHVPTFVGVCFGV